MAVVDSSIIDLQTEIGQVLNSAGGSVNVNKPLTYFTESAKINESSKNKPMEYDEVIEITDAQKKEVMYGHTIPNTTEFINANSAPEALTKPWTYSLPTSYKRLSDFVGYDSTVKVVKGDWGVTSIYDALKGFSSHGSFVSKLNTIDLYNNYDAVYGSAFDLAMRDNNPSKTTQINPNALNMRIAYVVYTAIPAASPKWTKVKAFVLPRENEGSTTPYYTRVYCSDLGFTKETIQNAELFVRVIGYAYKSTIGDGNDLYPKYSLSFTEGMNSHDIYITSGAYFTLDSNALWVDRGSDGKGLRLYGNLYITNNAPVSGSGSNTLAPSVSSMVYGYVRFYYQDALVKTFSVANSNGNLTYVGNEHPTLYSVCTVHFQISASSMPSNWDYALCMFTGPTITTTVVKSETLRVNNGEGIFS